MGFSIETGISAFTVFMQGLLSFFSPCVLPLVPLYLGYLSGGLNTAVRTGENSEKNKDRLKLFLRVLFFTVGIGSAFFILGLGASAAGSFFHEQRMLFARVGGILVVLFGLYQLGVFGSSKVLGSEHRFPIRLEKIHKNGIHVFKVVDQFGNDVVKRKGNVIIDYGDRIVRKRLDQVQDVDGSEFKQLNLF